MFKIEMVLKLSFKDYSRKAKKRLASNLSQAGDLLANAMKAEISTPYPPPSAPGEAPHTRTGELLGSISSIFLKESATVKVGSFGPGFAAYLEFGTSKMGARPFIWPTLIAKKKEILAKVARPAAVTLGRVV